MKKETCNGHIKTRGFFANLVCPKCLFVCCAKVARSLCAQEVNRLCLNYDKYFTILFITRCLQINCKVFLEYIPAYVELPFVPLSICTPFFSPFLVNEESRPNWNKLNRVSSQDKKRADPISPRCFIAANDSFNMIINWKFSAFQVPTSIANEVENIVSHPMNRTQLINGMKFRNRFPIIPQIAHSRSIQIFYLFGDARQIGQDLAAVIDINHDRTFL